MIARAPPEQQHHTLMLLKHIKTNKVGANQLSKLNMLKKQSKSEREREKQIKRGERIGRKRTPIRGSAHANATKNHPPQLTRGAAWSRTQSLWRRAPETFPVIFGSKRTKHTQDAGYTDRKKEQW